MYLWNSKFELNVSQFTNLVKVTVYLQIDNFLQIWNLSQNIGRGAISSFWKELLKKLNIGGEIAVSRFRRN